MNIGDRVVVRVFPKNIKSRSNSGIVMEPPDPFGYVLTEMNDSVFHRESDGSLVELETVRIYEDDLDILDGE